MKRESIKTIVATSFFSGVIIMFVLMYWLTGPHYAYSQSIEILQTEGYVYFNNGVLMYSAEQPELNNRELEALTKLSTVYVIQLDLPAYFELDTSSNE